jgi:hypothetical protein
MERDRDRAEMDIRAAARGRDQFEAPKIRMVL